MNLETVLYIMNVITNISAGLNFLIGISVAAAFGLGMYKLLEGRDADTTYIKTGFKYITIVMPAALALNLLVPSEKTMYLMLGTHIGRTVVENPKVQVISDKIFKIMSDKLDELEKPSKKESK